MSAEAPNNPIPTSPGAAPVAPGSSQGVANAMNQVYNSTQTPIPAAVASASLLTTLSTDKPGFKPTRTSVLGFGGAFALGAFMIYDGDLVNGAGFTSAWSVLYLMVNGRAAIRQFKILPLGIAGLVGANAVGYGREFFFPRKPVSGFSL